MEIQSEEERGKERQREVGRCKRRQGREGRSDKD